MEVGEIVDGVVGEVLRWLARLAIVVEQAGGAFSDAVVQAWVGNGEANGVASGPERWSGARMATELRKQTRIQAMTAQSDAGKLVPDGIRRDLVTCNGERRIAAGTYGGGGALI